MPAGIEALWWSGRCLDGGSADAIVVCLENSAKDQVSFNAQICSAGQPVVVVQRLRMARVRAAAPDAGVKTPKT